MGMKEERAKHAQAAQDRLYDAIDERCGWKEPSKKILEEKKKKEEAKKTPPQCEDCRFRINMCWLGKMRNGGQNFLCQGKQIDVNFKKETDNETME